MFGTFRTPINAEKNLGRDKKGMMWSCVRKMNR